MARPSRLPSRFPVGTHYVVEGVPGKDGELLITARYVVLPNGTQVILPVSDSRPLVLDPRPCAIEPRLLAAAPRRRRGSSKRVLHA